MGFYINRRKLKNILILLIATIITSCSFLSKKNKVYSKNDYLFVIQLKNEFHDTISFETIEIYTPNRILNLSLLDQNGNKINPTNKYMKLCNRSIGMGCLKGVKKSDLGQVLLLSAKFKDIDNNGFVTFDFVKKSRIINLNNYYRFPH